jgi:hypothetical protein
VISATFGFLFLVLLYVVQNPLSSTVIISALFLMVLFGVFLTKLAKEYTKVMNKLKDLL